MLLASMKQVRFGYNDVPCLDKASLHIHSGEFVAVTGPNGAAKTTLLKLLLKLLRPWEGDVYHAPSNKDGRKLSIGYVPQHIASFNEGFPSTVLELVRSGRYARGSWLRKLRREDDDCTEAALRQVGMWQFRDRKIGELSGGQKQRICMARALAQQPDLLVMDEPTTGMDADSRFALYEWMRLQATDKDLAVVMVTHGLSEVSGYLDRTITLERKEESGWKCCTTTSCSGHFAPEESLR